MTPPAVTAALKRMTRDGLLRVERDGRIHLTRKGRAEAERLALRHQLAEKLLTDVIGLDWTRAHDAAERLEHGLSPEVEALLLKRFGADSTCPHGLPLRGGVARLRQTRGAMTLGEVPAGRTVEILCVYEKDPKFLEFLDGRSLRPGAQRPHPAPRIRRDHDGLGRRPQSVPRQARHQPHLGPHRHLVATAAVDGPPFSGDGTSGSQFDSIR